MRDLNLTVLRELIARVHTDRDPAHVAHFKKHAVSALMEHAGEHITLEGCAGLLSVATDNYAPRMATSWDMDAAGQDVWRMWRTQS
jgi:hypothetical protein